METAEERAATEEATAGVISSGRAMLTLGLPPAVLLLLTTLLTAAGAGGPVCGTVLYRGKVPPPVPVPESQSVRHLVKRDQQGHLAEAVVWLEGPQLGGPRRPARRHIIDQIDYFFVPNILAIRDGDTVQFLNSDGANHGVIGQSTVPENAFNIVIPPGGEYVHRFQAGARARAAGRPTLVRLRCPIHAAMSGWIVVFPHPYYAVTDKNGHFCIPHPPSGRWRLRVLHPDTGLTYSVEVEVVPGKRTEVQIVLGVGKSGSDGPTGGKR